MISTLIPNVFWARVHLVRGLVNKMCSPNYQKTIIVVVIVIVAIIFVITVGSLRGLSGRRTQWSMPADITQGENACAAEAPTILIRWFPACLASKLSWVLNHVLQISLLKGQEKQ